MWDRDADSRVRSGDSSLKDFGSRLTYVRMPPTDERERIEK